MSINGPTYILRAREGTGGHGEGTGGHGEGTGGHGRGAGGSLALFRDVFGLHGPYTHALGHGEGTEKHGRARGGHGGVTGGHGGVREGAGGCGRGWGCSHAFFAIEFGSNGPEIPHFRHFRPAIWVPLARNDHLGPRNRICSIELVGGRHRQQRQGTIPEAFPCPMYASGCPVL